MVARRLASVEACLRASTVVVSADLVPAAVDELERIVGGAYRPGTGWSNAGAARAGAADHVRAASALLTAFEYTGRLPYSMLAEELMQVARREVASDRDFVTCCEAARALCRLAALHDDAGVPGAAVVRPTPTTDATRPLLTIQAPHVEPCAVARGALGVALRELFVVTQ
jgi:uncharacterized protein YyaL (SSP411 family)